MRGGVRGLDAVFSRVSGRALHGGSIVVIRPPGRHGQYHPPRHILATSGGGDRQGRQWGHLDYLPYDQAATHGADPGDPSVSGGVFHALA
jgi:hypothetical protein